MILLPKKALYGAVSTDSTACRPVGNGMRKPICDLGELAPPIKN